MLVNLLYNRRPIWRAKISLLDASVALIVRLQKGTDFKFQPQLIRHCSMHYFALNLHPKLYRVRMEQLPDLLLQIILRLQL